MLRFLSLPPCAATLLLGFAAPSTTAADEIKVKQLWTQQVGPTTYFTVSFKSPADLRMPDLGSVKWKPITEGIRLGLGRLPRLVPQDDRTTAVYRDLSIEVDGEGGYQEFVGKVHGKESARMLFLYPTEKGTVPRGTRSLAPSLLRRTWGELPVTLDFGEATLVEVPAGKRDDPPRSRDLEGRWAAARVRYLAALEAQAPDFGYFGLARELTGRKYHVGAPPLDSDPTYRARHATRDLYETTTGAAALTESLALHRLLQKKGTGREERSVPLERVRGIDIDEHPWEKMMAGKKPAPEPLARLVPHDNYYVAFKSIRSLIEFGEHLDEWGTSALRAYEMTSRDYRLRERYERQLCIRSTGLAKKFGPLIVRGVALTGSDPYLREGSDVSVIFQVANRRLFLAAVEPFVQEAREKYGSRLRERKADYKGVAVESFVTPLREVSLHRAAFGDFVVYSNSPVALRRILDVHASRRKALADSLDFHYMRTVFRRGDKEEDGFAFLPDAFIRQLVGPASKIKEKRRLEALTSLTMLTNGALFVGSETGHLPTDRAALLVASGLKAEEVAVPDGKPLTWDGKRQVAASDVYNMLHFLTPLIELPIDKVTPEEEREYRDFREEYVRLWRRYFDPVGMRFSLREEQVRVETYILPLIRSSEYNRLRDFVGGGTTTLDLSTLSPRTLVQYVSHLNPNPARIAKEALGDWYMLRLEDGPAYRRLARSLVRRELEDTVGWQDEFSLLMRVPATAAVRIRNQKAFEDLLPFIRLFLTGDGSLETTTIKPPYRDVTIRRARFGRDTSLGEWIKSPCTFYHAYIDDAWYVSTRADVIRDQIDRSAARRAGKSAGKKVEVNTSLYFAPEAAFEAAGAIRGYLEWETFRRALGNGPLWSALRDAWVVDDADTEKARKTAFHFLGFVPVSPDMAPYTFQAPTGEVINVRHGSYARPQLHDDLDDTSPVAHLLDRLATIRADLRFREDGVHTVLTIKWKKAEK